MTDVAEVNQLRWLQESGQWLENVDLVWASGKLVLQKRIMPKNSKNVAHYKGQ